MQRLNAPSAWLTQRLQYRHRIGDCPGHDFFHGHVAVVLPDRRLTLGDEAFEVEHVSPLLGDTSLFLSSWTPPIHALSPRSRYWPDRSIRFSAAAAPPRAAWQTS